MLKEIVKVRVFLKSGSSITGWYDLLKWKTKDSNVTELEWVRSHRTGMRVVVVDQIEAIETIGVGYRFMTLKEIKKVLLPG